MVGVYPDESLQVRTAGPDDGAPQGPAHPDPEQLQGQQPVGEVGDPKASNKDIQGIIRGWDYEPGTINVRKVSGADGQPKLQMRLDLGFFKWKWMAALMAAARLGANLCSIILKIGWAEHQRRHSTDLGFTISSNECQSLREEAVMYYQRYLSLFVLEDFSGVVRDTSRNLRVLDLCNKFAADEDDKMVLEQYRPYITMMNARARASIQFRDKRYVEALREVDAGLREIREFFDRYGQPEGFGHANEVKVLKRFARDIRRKMPVDPMQRAQKKLDRAIKDERYEEAARWRDKIAELKGEPEGPRSARV